MEKEEKKDNNIKCCFVFAVLAFILNFIAFVSPYWLVSIEGLKSEFTRLGLWVACFNGYVHPEDYVSKKYYGCWYVYWPEYDYIRDWLNPPWFYAVQMLSSLSLLCNGLAFILIMVKLFGIVKATDLKTNVLAIIVQVVAVCCYIVVIVSMGVMSKDRNWMPRPDHNRVSWSFGFAVVGAFFSIFSVFNLFIHYIIYNLAPEYKKKMKKCHGILLQENAGGTMNKSHVSSGSGMYGVGHPGGSTIYSQGGKPATGTTSGATASAKVREAMSQKKNQYGGSAASLNSLGQIKNRTGSSHSLASMGRGVPPPSYLLSQQMPAMNPRGSMSSLHSNSRPIRNGNISSGDSVV